MTDLSDDPVVRRADLWALLKCACEHTARCNPARQRIARQVGLAPADCVVRENFWVHTNPTSREEAPF